MEARVMVYSLFLLAVSMTASVPASAASVCDLSLSGKSQFRAGSLLQAAAGY
jgi:hypothetical protein